MSLNTVLCGGAAEGIGLATNRSQVQFQAGPFSCNIGQLSLASSGVAKSRTCFGWG